MKLIRIAAIAILMHLSIPVHAFAAMPGPKSVSARITAMFALDALSGWSGSVEIDGRWRVHPDWNIWFDGQIHSLPGILGIRTYGLELTGRYSAGEFSLWVPGKIRMEESGQTAALAVEALWRPGHAQLGAKLGWEQEWSEDPLRGYVRCHGEIGAQWLPSASFRSNFVLYAAVRREPGMPEDDYVFANARCDGRWSPGPRTSLKTGIELAAYRYPDAPDDNRTRYEWTAEFSWRPGKSNMRLGGEYEWSGGRLSESYHFQQVWARADVSLWGGILSASARLDGTVFQDPDTSARDRLHWQLVAGFSRSVDNLSFRIQLFYDASVYEDGSGQWVIGPVVMMNWQIADWIGIGIRWAPEGDFSGGNDILELSFSFAV